MHEINLHDLRILVTRPRPQGEVLCEKINSLQGHAIYFPTIEIIPSKNLSAARKVIKNLDQFAWVIFISSQAVYHSINIIREYWAKFPEKTRIATVGADTANELSKANFPQAIYPENDWRTEGLLALPQFKDIQHDKILIIKGEGGRELLADTLIERGALVMQLDVYRRHLPEHGVNRYIHLFQSHALDIIVVTSKEGLQNLLTLIGAENAGYVRAVKLVVVSKRLAEYANSLGFEKVILAENASHECILKVLCN